MATIVSDLYRCGIHPRVFFGPDDIAGLRSRAAEGITERAWRELCRRGDAYLAPGSDEHIDLGTGRAAFLKRWGYGAANHRGGPLHALAFAHVVEATPERFELAVAMMRLVADFDAPAVAQSGPHGARYTAPEWIHYAALAGDLPLAYDLLFNDLSAADRELVGGYLRRHVVTPFRRDYLDQPHLYAGMLGVNPPWHELSVYIWTLAAIFEPDADAGAFEQLAAMVRIALHRGVDQAGVIGEGPNYGRHDIWRWTTAAEILYRAGVADLWQEEPLLRLALRHWANLLLPGRAEIMNRGDSQRHYGCGPLYSHLLAARRLRDPLCQHIYNTLGGRGDIPGHGSAPECLDSPGFVLLWDDQDAVAAAADAAGLPTAVRGQEFGVNIMRSGWAGDDLYLSLLASGRTPGCVIHNHLDGGHFSLFALGEAFSIEGGYGDIQGRHHSVMLPNGVEPPTSPTGFDTVWAGGRTIRFASGTHADVAGVDISAQWDCYWNRRHAVVVRAPGAEPYVLIIDDVNYRSDWATYDWLLNSEPGNRIAIDAARETAVIHGRTNRLELCWAYPGASDYPRPHALALATDELASESLNLPGGRQSLGIGLRPRLKATLSGYNGLLLSALVPRRQEQPPVVCGRLTAPLQFGLTLDHGACTDTVLCNPVSGQLGAANISGEALCVVVRRDARARVTWAAAIAAYSLRVDGRELMLRQGNCADLWACQPSA